MLIHGLHKCIQVYIDGAPTHGATWKEYLEEGNVGIFKKKTLPDMPMI